MWIKYVTGLCDFHRKGSKLSRFWTKQRPWRQRRRRWKWGRPSWQKEAMLSGKFFSINDGKKTKKRKSEYHIHFKLCLLPGAQSDPEGRTSLMMPGGSELPLPLCVWHLHSLFLLPWTPALGVLRAPELRGCSVILREGRSVTLNWKPEGTVLLPPLNTVKFCISLLETL